ncbi:MAG: (deoxy)nucleoside triphosphate pyrophosphohydrolase [Kutzneria sp.]|nr:(deoxy)nucleoside triphosphate pyrophosphohydrolase [Kutzneria sp.]
MPVVVGAAIVRSGRVLAQQRAFPPDCAGRWEFPGGRVEAGESETDALARECREELGVSVRPGQRLGADLPLANGTVLRIYLAALVDPRAEPVAVEHGALRWVDSAELSTLPWLDADVAVLPDLRVVLAGGPVH